MKRNMKKPNYTLEYIKDFMQKLDLTWAYRHYDNKDGCVKIVHLEDFELNETLDLVVKRYERNEDVFLQRTSVDNGTFKLFTENGIIRDYSHAWRSYVYRRNCENKKQSTLNR